MKIKHKILVIFAVLALIIGAYQGHRIFLRIRLLQEGEQLLRQIMEAEIEAGIPGYMPGVDSHNIQRLVLHNSGLTLERIQGIWHITAPETLTHHRLDQNVIQMAALTLATIWYDRGLEVEPADLSVFGLDEPSAMIEISDYRGNHAVIIAGDLSPSLTSIYMQTLGDPMVYLVPLQSGNSMHLDLNAIRDKTLFSSFEMLDIQYFMLETANHTIEIIPKPDDMYGVTVFTIHAMLQPYAIPRGVDSERFMEVTDTLLNLMIDDYIDYSPLSYAPYGLENPARLYLETHRGRLNLLIGDEVERNVYYVKTPDHPEVFTVYGLRDLLTIRPFELADHFAIILNIDGIEGFRVEGAGRVIDVNIFGAGNDAIFMVNGTQAEDQSFRDFYRTVIGLMMDAEFPPQINFQPSDSEENIFIEYTLMEPAGFKMSFELLPYNRDFYAMREGGRIQPDFLVARRQVQTLFDFFDSLGFYSF
ncbi:MAG: DUF4340 domain-containing protein [Treponema sp.]|nr:DUF4340 domain-containing protein [Treponema sp.]